MARRRPLWAIAQLLVFAWVSAPLAQEMAIPVEVQVPLFLKLLHFERQLQSRPAGDTLVIGIAYQQRFRASLDAKDAFVAAVAVAVAAEPLRCAPLALDRPEELASALAASRAQVLYLCPLRAADLKEIARIAREHRVLTLTGVPEYVGAGAAVGIDNKGQKPLMLISLSAAKAAGADFSSRVLSLRMVKVFD